MDPKKRRERILERVYAEQSVLVDDLARELGCSRETLRRDLGALARRGLVRKFHGGAELPATDGENPFQMRMSENARGKRRIADLAASLFHSGDSLLIDTGTTTVYFAKALAKSGTFSIITNSTIIADIFAHAAGEHTVFLIGGQYHGDASETLGSIAVEQARIYRAAHAVVTVAAIDGNFGITDYSLEESQIARTMLAQAQQRTVIADSSKFDRTALFEVCPLERIDRLVTDEQPPPRLKGELEKAGVEILIAGE